MFVPSFRRSRLRHGFTLVEVLVVLVLVSLLSVLLVDGISQVLQIQVRLAEKGRSMQRQSLENGWFRRVLRGAIADKYAPFELESKRIQGLTLDPLLGNPGVPATFSLELRTSGTDVALQYTEGGHDPIDLARWPAADAVESFSFNAVQDNGNLGSRWLEGASSKEQLPKGVSLRIPLQAGEQWWHVSMVGRREPKLLVTEELGI